MASGRSPNRDDDRPGERRSRDVDLATELARAREAAAKGDVSSVEHRRRVAAALSGASVEELGAAATELSTVLGAAPAGDARAAALERLAELRAAGAISEENFAREQRRLLGLK